jgi:hypothetical protein
MSLVAYAATAGNRVAAMPGITVKEINTIGESIGKAVILVDPGVDWHGDLDCEEADALLRSNGYQRVFSWVDCGRGLWAASVVPL